MDIEKDPPDSLSISLRIDLNNFFAVFALLAKDQKDLAHRAQHPHIVIFHLGLLPFPQELKKFFPDGNLRLYIIDYKIDIGYIRNQTHNEIVSDQ